MRRIAASILLIFVLALPAWADSLLKLPDNVHGDVSDFIPITATTNCKVVRWYAIDTGLRLFPPDLLKDTRTAVVVASTPGTYRLLAYTATPDGSLSEPAICLVTIAGPTPPVPPGPTPPGPNPPPIPVPVSGLRVLFVYESGANLTREQLNILNSTTITDYLNRKTAKDTKGRAEWRKWDKDVDMANETDVWKNLWTSTKPQLGALPALVVVTDQKGQVFPLPATEAETLALLKRYGGE